MLAAPAPSSPRVEVASVLAAPPVVVGARVATLDRVHHELGPWLRMTGPAGARIDVAAVAGQRPVAAKFRHRHRRVRGWFGEAA